MSHAAGPRVATLDRVPTLDGARPDARFPAIRDHPAAEGDGGALAPAPEGRRGLHPGLS